MIQLTSPQSDQIIEPTLKRDLCSIDIDNDQFMNFEFRDRCNEERDSPELQISMRISEIGNTRDYTLLYPGATEYLKSSVYDYDLLVTLATDKFKNLADCH